MFSNSTQMQTLHHLSQTYKHQYSIINKTKELLIQGQLQQTGCFNGAYFLLRWSNWNSNIMFLINTFIMVLKWFKKWMLQVTAVIADVLQLSIAGMIHSCTEISRNLLNPKTVPALENNTMKSLIKQRGKTPFSLLYLFVRAEASHYT